MKQHSSNCLKVLFEHLPGGTEESHHLSLKLISVLVFKPSLSVLCSNAKSSVVVFCDEGC